MNKVDLFLKKIIESISSSKKFEEVVIESVKEFSGVLLSKDNFEIKDNTLIIKAHPAIRQEILLKKEVIISFVNNKISDKKLINVR